MDSKIGPTGAALALSSATPFPNRTRHACVRSPTETVTAARRCTMPRYHLSRQVHVDIHLGLVASQSLLSKISSCQSSHFLQLADHEALLKRHAVQRSRFQDSILRENDVFVCHWRLSNPDSMTPSPIWIACWHGCVDHSFSEWQHQARVRFPKNTHNRQAPCCVSNQPRYQHAVIW